MSTIAKIVFRNFKGFPNEETTVNLGGKHLLLYGENGSGKSSIYWGLYSLFQSGTKSKQETAKYFIPNNPENLINLNYIKQHPSFTIDINGNITEPQSIGNNAFVEVYFEDGSMEKIDHSGLSGTPPTGSTFRNLQSTENLNRHSDFIAHRLLINFYNYRNSKEINLWEVFVRDVFPFLMNQSGYGNKTLSQLLNEIETNKPYSLNNTHKTFKLSKSISAQTYYIQLLQDFNDDVNYWISQINTYANDFYQTHFEPLYNDKIRLSLEYKTELNFSKHTKQFYKKDNKIYERWTNNLGSDKPIILLKIETQNEDGSYTTINRPQSYLNEAKLTSIALAIRFSLLNDNIRPPHNGQFLALDDLLVSLDMSNRDKVLDIILGEFATKYKIYLFTHEKSFFDFCLFKIKQHNDRANWNIQEIYEPDKKEEKPIIINSEFTNQEKAEKYFKAKDYVTTSLYLRKEFEKVITERLPKEFTKTVDGEFHNLAHYWKLFKEHYAALGLNVSDVMNNEFEQSKMFILNKQAHHNLSEPVYTLELKNVFKLIKEIKDNFPIPKSTILLSKGITLKFIHPSVDYTFEFELLSDFERSGVPGNEVITYPKCKVLYFQFNTQPYWDFQTNRQHTEKFFREKISIRQDRLNKIKSNLQTITTLNITDAIFFTNTIMDNGIWSLKEVLDKSGVTI